MTFQVTSAIRSTSTIVPKIKSGRPRRYTAATVLLESGLGYGYTCCDEASIETTTTTPTPEVTPMSATSPARNNSTAADVAIMFLIALSVMVTVGASVIAHLYVLGKHFITGQLGQPLVTELGYTAQTVEAIASNTAATVEAHLEPIATVVKAVYTTQIDVTAAVSVGSLVVAGWIYTLEKLATIAAMAICGLQSWEARQLSH